MSSATGLGGGTETTDCFVRCLIGSVSARLFLRAFIGTIAEAAAASSEVLFRTKDEPAAGGIIGAGIGGGIVVASEVVVEVLIVPLRCTTTAPTGTHTHTHTHTHAMMRVFGADIFLCDGICGFLRTVCGTFMVYCNTVIISARAKKQRRNNNNSSKSV